MRRESRLFPRRGEVYDVNFDPVVGSEISKLRPAVIVSNDANNRYSATVTVVPFTSATSRRDYPFEARLPAGVGGLTSDSRAKCDQVRTVDKQRVAVRRGLIPADYQKRIDEALRIHLG